MKINYGLCQNCADGIEKPLANKFLCEFHYWPWRREEKEKEAKLRLERDTQLGVSREKKPKKSSIPKISEKRMEETKKYAIERLKFLSQPENHRCFIEGCSARANTIEHTRGRKGFADAWARENGISLYLDVRFWKPCCFFHNGELERNPELSQKYQLSKITGKPKLKK